MVTLTRERNTAVSERDVIASKRSTSTNGDSSASDDQKRQLATLKTQLEDASKAESALQHRVNALETKGGANCVGCAELRDVVERSMAEQSVLSEARPA